MTPQLMSAQFVSGNIGISEFRNADPRYAPILWKLASKGYPESLRRDAIHALRDIHTKATLPYLAQLLDSDSADFRYAGVTGLASFAKNLPIATLKNVVNGGWLKAESKGPYTTPETDQHFPAYDTFLKQEAKFIEFWKTWLETNKAALIQ